MSVEPFCKIGASYGCEVKAMRPDGDVLDCVHGAAWREARIAGVLRAAATLKSGAGMDYDWKAAPDLPLDPDTAMLARGLGFPKGTPCDCGALSQFIEDNQGHCLDAACISDGANAFYYWRRVCVASAE